MLLKEQFHTIYKGASFSCSPQAFLRNIRFLQKRYGLPRGQAMAVAYALLSWACERMASDVRAKLSSPEKKTEEVAKSFLTTQELKEVDTYKKFLDAEESAMDPLKEISEIDAMLAGKKTLVEQRPAVGDVVAAMETDLKKAVLVGLAHMMRSMGYEKWPKDPEGQADIDKVIEAVARDLVKMGRRFNSLLRDQLRVLKRMGPKRYEMIIRRWLSGQPEEPEMAEEDPKDKPKVEPEKGEPKKEPEKKTEARGPSVLISGKEDMGWLRDVHLPGLPEKFKSALIYGNEDYPDRIDVYTKEEPLVTDAPLVFLPDKEGVYAPKEEPKKTESEEDPSEPRTIKCKCGANVELDGDTECPKCGQWYNAFGQKLKDPSQWKDEPDIEEGEEKPKDEPKKEPEKEPEKVGEQIVPDKVDADWWDKKAGYNEKFKALVNVGATSNEADHYARLDWEHLGGVLQTSLEQGVAMAVEKSK